MLVPASWRPHRHLDLRRCGRELLWREGPDYAVHLFDLVGETLRLCRAHPPELEPFRVDAPRLEHDLPPGDPLLCLRVRADVVAVSGMASCHEDCPGTLREGVEDEPLRDSSRTHGPDDPRVGRILDLHDSGQVGPGVGAPVAGEDQDLALRPFLEGGVYLRHDLTVREVLLPEGALHRAL